MFQPFLIALQFLTRIPVRLGVKPSHKDIGYSIIYYPIVGLLIGMILAALSWLLSDVPTMVSTVLLLICWVLITGGLHLDGLADSADAWAGGIGNHERTLAIMKDPNCGPAGVVAILLLLMLKFATIHTLLSAHEWVAFILATTLGRAMLPLLLLTTPYVRSSGLGSILVAQMPRRFALFSIVTTSVLIPILLGINGLVIIGATAIVFCSCRYMMMQRIDGTTGDTAGALVEITEVAILLTAVLLLF